MFRFLIAVILLMMNQAAVAKSNIVVLGDSISAGYGLELGQGWVHLVQQKLLAANDCCTILNESISGDTSAGGLARLEAILTIQKPKILILELGANDGLRGLQTFVLKQTLAEIIRRSQKAGAKVLLLSMRIPPNYGKRYIDMFYGIYLQLSKELDVPMMPFLMEDVALVKDLMQPDGLHPNAKAQPIIADKVWHYLQPLLK
ncbi:arylesterase [Crenothrix polyspora]|uniref:Multifunctional acyl-CoA thioesterase I and protease I and lysophospholipase L1 n=1 Tax=Crenothrix polyspora TaxID=360316 RepID=A0A1R4H239_9GAMM|nr:arylesterase [Crenothrix polyspora]SJM90120.1 multifunctional acyl-CoA thioesterase I and protease I and lysophospholipase L1 [Crenothrix polyspora]